MAIAIPEAAGAVTGGTAAVRGAAAAGRSSPQAVRATYISRTQAPPRRPAGRQRQQRVIPAVNLPSGRNARRGALRGRVPGGRNYQPVILAEFLAAVLVVGLAPVAKGGTDTSKAKGSASPYDTNSMKQLLLIGLVYFILALLSSGRHAGRVAAWFGGLVLVGIGVQQTVNGGFAAVLRMFGLNVGGGLGTFPAGEGSGLLPGLNINVGQFSPGALASGVSAGGQQFAPVPDATGIFPVINPSTTQTGQLPGVTQGPPPGVAAGGSNVTQSTISPPPGGTGVITTGPGGGVA